MLTRLKNSRILRLILPRFSRRRALVAWVWHGLRGAWNMLKLVRGKGLVSALRQIRWRLKARYDGEGMALAAYVPPPKDLPRLLTEAYPAGLPTVSIVAPLFARGEELPFFLAAVFRQNYPGAIELVLVDDCCPDGSGDVARAEFARLKSQNPAADISLKLLRTGKNNGNCHARNLGMGAAAGDIIVVIDADCLMNAAFVSLHALYMAIGPYDALIGPCNLETKHRPPMEALAQYEAKPDLVRAEQKPQDDLCPTGFVNCITRNSSIRKATAPEPLFDEAFSYSADPASGYGWEDVALGRALYDAGLRLGYAEGSFTVHVSHQHDYVVLGRAVRSLRNFVKLLEKYPDMPSVAGRWVRQAYAGILQLDGPELPKATKERQRAEELLGEAAPPLLKSLPARRLRILSFHWHTSHQYELFKLPHDFFLARGLGVEMAQTWNFGQRPMPLNVRFIDYAKICPQDYDLAILPFDENVLAPENTNGVLDPAWGDLFKYFLQLPLPKIGLCHGTPQFYGQYDMEYQGPDLMRVIEPERLRLVEATRDFIVVCNSHQAEREWGFARSTTIWQGFDPMEFPLRPQNSHGCLTLGEATMRSRPFYNGYFIHKETVAALPAAPRSIKTPAPDWNLPKGNLYARAKFRNYVDELRTYSIYFNPTLRSPMPRTRGEAMLCGLVPIGLANHDADMFIKNGKNGFIGACPKELSEYIIHCLNNQKAAWRMGMEARKSAMEHFSIDRYLGQWQTILKATV